ncbi:FAD-dependent oxidoreductase [[Eubacterium] hominis]|uniref:oxidoreductase n=1 Tax=[Eubacterium] hominis TaxID=2764325 RepID=UPI003A4D9D6A
MTCKYPLLFQPLKVNQMILKNRIISAPLGSLTDKSISGIGMIIRGTSGCVPDGRSRMAPGPYCFEDMTQSAKVREQVSIIRQRGAKAEFELCHVGQYAKVKPGDYAIGPIGFIREDGTEVRAMDETMMNEVADAFAKGALDAKEYGFDMVMLHFGHGWLPTQFLSPHFNKRTDSYGGSFENRMKFPMMIVERVRKAVGKEYPIDMRISLDEHIADGTSTKEIIQFIQSIEHLIDMVHVSCGLERELSAMSRMTTSPYYPHMINTGLSKMVKEALHIPVAVVGAIMTPQEAESILQRKEADAVVIGRQIIADPFWTSKVWNGEEADIVPCLRCLNCYNMYAREKNQHYGMKSITCCSVNPRYLHENRVPVVLPKAQNKKLIYVIGGGPAGCKAALTAYERGHKVILMEKEAHLGGQLYCSEFDDSKLDLKRYKDYLIYQIMKSDIEVRLSCDAQDHREEMKHADTIIVAVGAQPMKPRIEGIEQKHVMNALYAYEHQDEIKQQVAIIGGGSVGTELAKLLVKSGRQVSLVEWSRQLCSNLNEHVRMGLLQCLKEAGDITILLEAECKRIDQHAITVSQQGKEQVIEAETVIYAVGMKAQKELANSFFHLIQDTNIIGDANRPATVAEATHDGYYVSASL